MNLQPIEKQNLNYDGTLEIHSIFYTIQGEGPFVGRPAIFIRLAGCNLQCPQCDTDYTSERSSVGPYSLLEQVQRLDEVSLIVITGGEPFRQNLVPAVNLLLGSGYEVQIETNGTLYLPGFPYDKVTVVCSPKAGTLNRMLVAHPGAIHSLKYVAGAGNIAPDGLPIRALEHPAAPQVARPPSNFTGNIYLQPVDEKDVVRNQENLDVVVESCLQHGYTLGIQLHKLIGKD